MAKISLVTLQDSIQGVAELEIDNACEEVLTEIKDNAEEIKEIFSKHVFETLAKYQGKSLFENFDCFVNDMTNFEHIEYPAVYETAFQIIAQNVTAVLNEYKAIETADDENDAE